MSLFGDGGAVAAGMIARILKEWPLDRSLVFAAEAAAFARIALDAQPVFSIGSTYCSK
jgi:hypothetical protein